MLNFGNVLQPKISGNKPIVSKLHLLLVAAKITMICLSRTVLEIIYYKFELWLIIWGWSKKTEDSFWIGCYEKAVAVLRLGISIITSRELG